MAITPHLLLVEDEGLVSLLWSETLAASGFRVSTVSSAEAALRVLMNDRVSAVILDIGLPGMPGDRFAAYCRKEFPMLPLLMVTGYDARSYAELAADRYVRLLQKPIDSAVLLTCLEELLTVCGGPVAWPVQELAVHLS